MKFLSLLLAASACLVHALPTSESSPLLEKRQSAALTDYAYVYFTGEGFSNGEQVYMAVSNNNNPGSWTRLKSGNPFLTSNVGTKGIRDPSFIVAPDRSKYWIICTDLKVNGYPGGWESPDYTTKGSKSIVVWESTNLRDWSGPFLRKVSPDNAGMTWAPDAIWDPSRSKFMVFWTSAISGQGWKTLKSYTSDFVNFSAAETFVTGLGMDNTIVFDKSQNRFIQISKNGPDNLIQQNWASTLAGPWTKTSERIGAGLLPAAEGPLIFQNNQTPSKWHLWVDNYTRGSGYFPMETSNLASGQWSATQGFTLPPNARHGYVIGITSAERNALLGQGTVNNPTTTSTPSTPTSTTTPTPTQTNGGGTVAKWGQCGGNGYTGPTQCIDSTCVKSNDWYSQCI